MQNTTYPHLANLDGGWEIVHLDKWTPTKNQYLPLRYRELQALDELIAKHIRPMMPRGSECFVPGKIQHAFRSPYNPAPNVRPIYYINYAKAILSVRLNFSYHNWYDCLPEGTKLTRICPSVGCYNPNHHIFGSKPRRTMVDLEQLVDMSPELESWIELTTLTIPSLVLEAKEVGDSKERIVQEVTRIAADIWGDRPIPPTESCRSLKELVQSCVEPTRMTDSHVTSNEILSWLDRKGDK